MAKPEGENFQYYLPRYLPHDFEGPYKYITYPKCIERWDVSYYIQDLQEEIASRRISIKISRGQITDPIKLPLTAREYLTKEYNGTRVSIEFWARKPEEIWHIEYWRWLGSPNYIAIWNCRNINFRVEATNVPREEVGKIIESMIPDKWS
jgi:hypothetical protein